MGGKRKFRLSNPKNYERKKYDKPVIVIPSITHTSSLLQSNDPPVTPDPLIVCILIIMYSKATVSTSEQLLGRLKKLKVIPY